MRPVITVTLNPAVDRTVWIDRLIPGSTHRTADTRATIGGKGINVARTVVQSGVPAFALGVAGEDQAASIEAHLSSLGVGARFLATPGETRTNLKLIEQSTGRMTEINGSGPAVSPGLVGAVEAELMALVARMDAAAVVLAGSLPVGVDVSIYARWTRLLRDLERPVAVLADASGEPLAQVVAAEPWLVKPNRVEAETLVGHPILSVEDGRLAASEIGRLGPSGVLLSLGAQGAVGWWNGKSEWLPAESIDPRASRLLTTVGAGDAMVARVAIELARRDSTSGLEDAAFFEICRQAVVQAAWQISGSASFVGNAGLDAATARPAQVDHVGTAP